MEAMCQGRQNKKQDIDWASESSKGHFSWHFHVREKHFLLFNAFAFWDIFVQAKTCISYNFSFFITISIISKCPESQCKSYVVKCDFIVTLQTA